MTKPNNRYERKKKIEALKQLEEQQYMMIGITKDEFLDLTETRPMLHYETPEQLQQILSTQVGNELRIHNKIKTHIAGIAKRHNLTDQDQKEMHENALKWIARERVKTCKN